MVKRVIDKIRRKLGKSAAPAPKKKTDEKESAKSAARPKQRAARQVKREVPREEVYEPGAARHKKGASPAPPQEKTQPRAETDQPAATRPPRRRRRPKPRPVEEEPAPQEPPPEPWDLSQFQVPQTEGLTRFHDLDLPDEIMHAVADLGFLYCTPIQAEVMPASLKGSDATGRAQTGTGKTAAFLLTIFSRILREPKTGDRKPGTPRALILAPTRELVLQIEEEANTLSLYCGTNTMAVFGGMDYEKQKRRLAGEKIDVMVATPGRLIDFMRQKILHLRSVEILVIDEADRMLDMGFIPDVRSIVRGTPPKAERQTMLFSATLTPEVTRLASQWTKDPVTVEIEPEQVAVNTVNQVVYIATARQKFAMLYNILTRQGKQPVLVFCNRRDVTQRITEELQDRGIDCAMLSGAVAQEKRLRTLENFRNGKVRVLVATDVAGRGIHVEGISHVINFSLPVDPEDYVHRIGRTGRAGATGTAISFACEEDSFYLPDIEKYIGHELPCTHPEDAFLEIPPDPVRRRRREPSNSGADASRRGGRSSGGSGRSSGGGGRGRGGQGSSGRPRRPSSGRSGGSRSGNRPKPA